MTGILAALALAALLCLLARAMYLPIQRIIWETNYLPTALEWDEKLTESEEALLALRPNLIRHLEDTSLPYHTHLALEAELSRLDHEVENLRRTRDELWKPQVAHHRPKRGGAS